MGTERLSGYDPDPPASRPVCTTCYTIRSVSLSLASSKDWGRFANGLQGSRTPLSPVKSRVHLPLCQQPVVSAIVSRVRLPVKSFRCFRF